jgi:hypothetical protein
MACSWPGVDPRTAPCLRLPTRGNRGFDSDTCSRSHAVGPYARVVKATQVGVELRRCDYTLLGWDDQDTLYGEELCGERHRYSIYNPVSEPAWGRQPSSRRTSTGRR